ncbi:helix-turn-helix transcriptional regulator [Candidatus Thiothrix sp. Deng01]|uniref:Helix-turn-helix transcriptional regulator n=1 Tax=Candidatus Thiothrix phosphatis TaxID=3112415 RepID=A0ABU6CVM6_9GAMM|nr:helix-turn-helix transcriptional regulator [Candidatus Thiothrix sp. Deng01]MEB4590834.1 helix-turn-helix transcriptional regulator [Candidatus Thiothrix sp. Deng01]
MDMHSLGETLRNARKQLQLTQAELCRKTGISRATLSGIENGTVAEIGIRKIMALCSALGLELTAQPLSPRRPTLQSLVNEAEQRKTGRKS